MTVFVLVGWGGRVTGVVSSEKLARERGYKDYDEDGPSEGYFDIHEVDKARGVSAE